MVFKSDIIGHSVPRIDGPDKVTGKTLYAADVVLPGMLCGKILRSPYPHARVRSVDTAEAWAVPGVRAVVTGEDIPETRIGRRMADMPVLAQGVVRFVGERSESVFRVAVLVTRLIGACR